MDNNITKGDVAALEGMGNAAAMGEVMLSIQLLNLLAPSVPYARIPLTLVVPRTLILISYGQHYR